jgi:hypothetical protein
MCEFVPPVFADPLRTPSNETGVLVLVFAKNRWPIDIKYIEKGIIVKDMD